MEMASRKLCVRSLNLFSMNLHPTYAIGASEVDSLVKFDVEQNVVKCLRATASSSDTSTLSTRIRLCGVSCR